MSSATSATAAASLSASAPAPPAPFTFDNAHLRELPVSPDSSPGVRQVRGACFVRAQPTPLASLALVAASSSALALLDVTPADAASPPLLHILGGNAVPPGADPVAHVYAGHQFGSFAGQLGDGAALSLGCVVSANGIRTELQLKGAGPTPCSRTADGRKVLRSSLREFVCSEAMHVLGIPTTRAAALVVSREDTVSRDPAYSGAPRDEPCAVVTRLAPSFLRFGSCEVVLPVDPHSGRGGPSPGNAPLLRALLDHTARWFYPTAWEGGGTPATVRYAKLFDSVVASTAQLVAAWQCVGFTHGVLNTDNCSLLGLTIDYGPYGWMELTNKHFVPNTSDDGGRYSYGNQPGIMSHNCERLGAALKTLPELADWDVPARVAAAFRPAFESAYWGGMGRKLGLEGGDTDADTQAVVQKVAAAMQATGSDWTLTWRALGKACEAGPAPSDVDPLLSAILAVCATPAASADALKPGTPLPTLERLSAMVAANPSLLGSYSGLEEELARLESWRAAADVTPAAKRGADAAVWIPTLASVRAHWGVRSPSAALACRTNPAVVLRNWLAQTAIVAAEKGDYTVVNDLLGRLDRPYEEDVVAGTLDYAAPAPPQLRNLKVSCSS